MFEPDCASLGVVDLKRAVLNTRVAAVHLLDNPIRAVLVERLVSGIVERNISMQGPTESGSGED